MLPGISQEGEATMLEEMMPFGVRRDFIATTVSKEIYIADLAAWPTGAFDQLGVVLCPKTIGVVQRKLRRRSIRRARNRSFQSIS